MRMRKVLSLVIAMALAALATHPAYAKKKKSAADVFKEKGNNMVEALTAPKKPKSDVWDACLFLS